MLMGLKMSLEKLKTALRRSRDLCHHIHNFMDMIQRANVKACESFCVKGKLDWKTQEGG